MNLQPRHLTMQAAREDRTERDLFDAFLVGDDFRAALAEVQTVSQAIQIKERVTAVVAYFMDVENAALERANMLKSWGN